MDRTRLDHIEVEERHPPLQPVRHRHPVATLQVEPVQLLHRADQLGVQALRVVEVAVVQVLVAAEELVGPLAGEDHLDVGGGQPGDR